MTAAAVVDPQPDLDTMVSPGHTDDAPWGYPASSTVKGSGACAGTTLGALADAIRARVAAVSAIATFRPSGPEGVTMDAGPAVPAGDPPPPATGSVAFWVGLGDERGFGIAFFRGQRCRGDQCEAQERWYYDTDASCRPRWVGHLATTERAGGHDGRCVDVDGASLWSLPGQPSARARCDADWSAHDISGHLPALSLNAGSACGGSAASFVPVEVTISQGADLGVGRLLVEGTGIAFLDGRTLSGKVVRQDFNGELEESVPGSCPLRRRFRFSFDFEDRNPYGLPGAFGILDIHEEAEGQAQTSCPKPAPGCSASLHFIRR